MKDTPSRPSLSRPLVAGAQGLVAALMEEAHRAAASGRRELARQRLESALYLLRTPEDAGIASTLLRRIARTYIDDGNFEAALDCLAVAEAVAAARHSHADIAHVRNSQATICVNRGALDEAERLMKVVDPTVRDEADPGWDNESLRADPRPDEATTS